MMGRGDPFREGDGSYTHPQRAKTEFLTLVGNPQNDPKKGWTCEFEWDLKIKFGLNPTSTPAETLFKYIGEHHLGYRIAMNCGPKGQIAGYWGCAVDNGIMPFAPHCNNFVGYRFDDPIGIHSAVSVAGGRRVSELSYGQSLEFIEAIPVAGSKPAYEDVAESWANQGLAAKFSRVLDAHPNFNIWDAREYLRQAASFWTNGWTETNGYGRMNERAVVGRLLPGPPVEFQVVKSRDNHSVSFTWRNFRQTDFLATVIAAGDGRILYEGAGTNFTWRTDVDGDETFRYWSKNKSGEISRMETYQRRTVTGLNRGAYQTCVVFEAPGGGDGLSRLIANRFEQVATNWVCDLMARPGNPYYDKLTAFPAGEVAAILPDFSAMTSRAISNHYRIIIAPVTYQESNSYRFKKDWDRAAEADVLVVVPHSASMSLSRKPEARRLAPPRLFSAVTVGEGLTTNRMSFGPGLEFFDAPRVPAAADSGLTNEMDAAGVVAGKLAQILEANPGYNIWDARQHLRQSSSHYGAGWVEDGGYGRPPATPSKIASLDAAPPLDIQATKSSGGDAVTFQWRNFLQRNYSETIITREDGRTIYHGTGTNFTWRSDVNGTETFHFFSKDKAGRLSRPESYTVHQVGGLRSGRPAEATSLRSE